MPARDRYHHQVRAALEKDGWTITHDPLRLTYGRRDLYVDLGAERLIAAEREGEKIAVEVKTFGSSSDLVDLEQALGQYLIYNTVLTETQPDRLLFLAVTTTAYDAVFTEEFGELMLRSHRIRLMVFDEMAMEVREWKG
jgi:hypothetical protein